MDTSETFDSTLDTMFRCLHEGDPIYLPSRFWEALNQNNLSDLRHDGYKHFKRTVAQNYFTWIIGPRDPQFRYLLRHTRLNDWLTLPFESYGYDATSGLSRKKYIFITVFTRMIWLLARQIDTDHVLDRFDEPPDGDPYPIYFGHHLISQDIANSVIEYYAIREQFAPSHYRQPVICELGAGYGRNAYIFLKAIPTCKYLIVDIPPALYVSQRYLSKLSPGRRIFSFRPFDNYQSIANEFEQSDIAFLLPHQAAMLPDQSVDLFINISSLHEMRFEQIQMYYQLIARLTRGYFYTKQWIESTNTHDGIVVRQSDYPTLPGWRELYMRVAKVQTKFFEAMYARQATPSVPEQALKKGSS